MLQNMKNRRFCNEMCTKTKTQENIEIIFNRKKHQTSLSPDILNQSS